MATRAGPAIIPARVAVTRGKSGSQMIVNAAASATPSQRTRPNWGIGPTVVSCASQDHMRDAMRPTSATAISQAR